MSKAVTIDLVTYDQVHDEFVLYLVEDGPWPHDEADWTSCLSGIQDRIFSAADVAIDGHLTEKYPDSAGKAIRIQVDSPGGCPIPLEDLVASVGRFLGNDQAYASAIRSSPKIRGIRVVTGKQMGRFR